MEKVYVHAVLELLASGTPIESVLANLRSVMAARGHEKALPAVLRGIVRGLQESAATSVPVVTIATSADATLLQADIKEVLAALGAQDTNATIVIDDTIIGGLIATYNHRQIDASYRTKLTTLYHQIVAK